MPALLEVSHVSKIYKDKHNPVHALNDVNLTINAGEIVALLGVNGAGKTTLSSILATLHPVTSGDVSFNGTSIYHKDNLLTYRKSLGFCPQKPNLDSYLNVRDNLIFAGRYYLMKNDEIIKRATFLMEQFGLTKYAQFNVNALSGGYKQRLSIARALMHHPTIVILDEPTVGLDPSIRRQLWEVIRELKAHGVTVIITTHYLDEAEHLSDRACILSRGKVILMEPITVLKEKHKLGSFEDIFIALTKEESNVE
jgi:ABC-2 type transport system ATP-binding protein